MKYWLISDEDVIKIKEGLSASTHEANDFNCPGGMLDEKCPGCVGDEERERARYALDTGLHITDAVPNNFK